MMSCNLRTHCAAGVFALLLLFSGSAAAFQIDIGTIGDILSKSKDAVTDIDEDKEILIGRELAAGLLGAAPLVESEELQQYVNRLGYWLVLQTERKSLPWHFAVLETDSINAFAVPGGYVFITRGLFMMLRDEAELAGVLAHEISHVLKKHHLAAIKKNAQTGLLTSLVNLKASDKGHNIEGLLDAGMTMYSRGLDKDDEYESDLMGVVIGARAGYRASGLHGVLLSLDALQAEGGGSQLSLMFKTHPSAQSRMEKLNQSTQVLSAYWNTPASIKNDRLSYFQNLLYSAEE